MEILLDRRKIESWCQLASGMRPNLTDSPHSGPFDVFLSSIICFSVFHNAYQSSDICFSVNDGRREERAINPNYALTV